MASDILQPRMLLTIIVFVVSTRKDAYNSYMRNKHISRRKALALLGASAAAIAGGTAFLINENNENQTELKQNSNFNQKDNIIVIGAGVYILLDGL